jgi:hypothetical protein
MNILILTGIFEESQAVLKSVPTVEFTFDRHTRAYIATLNDDVLYLLSTGPGLRKKKELRRLIRQVNPEKIINCGLAGVLKKNSDYKRGECIYPLLALSSEGNMNFLCNVELTNPEVTKYNKKCFSLNHLIYHPEEKMDLFLSRGAELCDMELYPLMEWIQSEFPELISKVHSLKILSDFPEDFSLYKNEVYLRGWSSKNVIQKLVALIKFPAGPFKAVKLILRKRYLLNKMGPEIEKMIKSWNKNI